MLESGHGRRLLVDTMRRRRGPALVSALGGVCHQACEILVPVVIGVVVDRAIAPSDGAALGRWLAVMAALFVVLNVSYRVQLTVGVRAMQGAEHDLRMSLCERVLAPAGMRPPAGIGDASGALLNVASDDARKTALVLQALSLAAGAASALVIAAIVLLGISLSLGLLVLLGSPPLVWLLHRASGPLQRRSEAEQARAADAASVATDFVRGARVLQGIGAEHAAAARYREVSGASLRATLRAATSASALEALNVLLGGLFLALVAYVAARQAVAGTISVGELVAAVGVSQFLIGPLERIGFVTELLARARASATRAAAVLAAPPLVGAGHAPLPADPPGAVRISSPPGAARLEVSVAAGEHVGLVVGDLAVAGALLDALARRAPDGATRVLVDGVPIDEVVLADQHRLLLVADHDAELFEGTVAENVTAASGELGAARRDAILAASAVDEVIRALREGADAPVGERGGLLSGGQRQRVALARALAAHAPVLVLHDPTTAVDPATEARIAAGLRRLRRTRTTLMICSSPALLAHCDRVLLVRDGAIAACGTHARLLAGDERYRAAVLG